PSVGSDLLLVPLSRGIAETGPRGNCIVNRPMILLGTDAAFVHGVAVIQDLDLHPLIGCVAFVGCTDTDAVVGARRQHKFEAKNEVREFLLGEEIASSISGANDFTFLNDIAGTVSADELPAVERLPVEQRYKAFFSGAKRGGHRKDYAQHA